MSNQLLMRRRAMSNTRDYIDFADPEVERICVALWSSNGIGLTYEDAAAITKVGAVFSRNKNIISFDEFQYFTGLEVLSNSEFLETTNLKRIILPKQLTAIGQSVFNSSFKTGGRIDVGNVTSIGYACFYVAKPDTFVLHSPTPPSVGSAALYGMDNTKFFVPYSADHSILTAYKTASGWSTYANNIFELD